MRFVREHAYETVLAVLIVIFGSSIVAFHRSVMEAVLAYPMQIAVLVILAALVGAFLCSLLDRKESLVERERQKGETERERVRLEADEAERKRKEEDRKREEEEREIAELEKLNGFSVVQLGCMLGCFCNETSGNSGIKGSFDDPTADSLVEYGVFTRHTGGNFSRCTFVLTPEWRAYIETHENDMRAMLGLELRDGGLPSEGDVESHLQHLHSKNYA